MRQSGIVAAPIIYALDNNVVNVYISINMVIVMGAWIILILITTMIGSYCLRDYTN